MMNADNANSNMTAQNQMLTSAADFIQKPSLRYHTRHLQISKMYELAQEVSPDQGPLLTGAAAIGGGLGGPRQRL